MNFKKLIDFNFLYYFLFGIDKTISLSTSLWFATLLTANNFGIYNQFSFLTSFFSNLLIFGVITPITLNFFSSKSNDFDFKKSIHFFLNFSIIIFLFLTLVFSPLKEDIFLFFFNNYNILVFFSFILSILTEIYSEFLILNYRLIRPKISLAFFITFKNVLKVFSFCLFYLMLNNFYLSLLISSVSSLIYILISFHVSFGFQKIKINFNLNIRQYFDVFKEGLFYLSFYLLTITSVFLTNLIIVNFFDLETLAEYSFNLTLASIPIFFTTIVSYFLWPKYLDYLSKNNFTDSFYEVVKFSITFLGFCVCFIFIFHMGNFLFQFKNYFNLFSNFVFSILVLNTFFLGINVFLQYHIVYSKKYSLLIIYFLTSLVVYFFSLYVLYSFCVRYLLLFSLLFSNFSLSLFYFFSFLKFHKKI